MTATAESAQEPADAPNTLEIAENPATSLQRTGNGIVVNGHRFGGKQFPPFTPESGKVAGQHSARQRTHRKQAEIVADTCFQMIVSVRQGMGLSPTVEPVTKPGAVQSLSNGDNGQATCESVSTPSAPSPAVKITRDDAQIVGLLTRGWDTALERLRVLKGVPDPGCRRPGEPIPKARKPANRAPDSLACGADTPTGSVPTK